MANANWSNPTLTSTYTNFVSEVKNRDEDLALQFDGTTSTNIPTNTIRWDSAANRWKKWNGSSWAELTSTYALTGLSTTGNASVSGTLGVTGAATLSSTLGVTGAITGTSTVSGSALIPTAATVPTNGVFLPAANTVAVATNSTERLRFTSTGGALLGTQTALTNAYAISTALTPALQIEGNTANGAALSITRHAAAANLLLQRGVTGTPVVDTDAVGQISFNGFDGTSYYNAALIRGVIEGTPGTGSMPGRLSLQTTPTGSTTPVERLRLDAAGQVLAASLGTASLPVWSFTGDPNTGVYSPGADQVSISTGGTQRLTVSTTAVTSTLPVVAPLGAVGTPSITFSGDLDTGIWSPAANTIAFSESGAEIMRLTSDSYMRMAAATGGIQFNGDTASANALDDYEQGTFTPTIIGTTAAGVGTYTTQNGRYTKIGNRVAFEITLVWTAHTGTGNMRAAGLPFTVSTNSNFVPVTITYSNLTSPSSSFVQCDLENNTTEVRIQSNVIATGVTAALAIDTAATVRMQGTYEV